METEICICKIHCGSRRSQSLTWRLGTLEGKNEAVKGGEVSLSGREGNGGEEMRWLLQVLVKPNPQSVGLKQMAGDYYDNC